MVMSALPAPSSALGECGLMPWCWGQAVRLRDTNDSMLPRSRAVSLPSNEDVTEHVLTLEHAYARYVPYVAKLALRLLGRPEEVDDLIQDVFVIATERFSTLRDAGALRGWLASITVHTAVRRLRRRRLRQLVSLDSDPQFQADLSPFLREGASAEHHRLLREVFQALDRLPARERIAWSLRVLEGEPMDTVARLCDCSLATAKRRVGSAQNLIDALVKR